MGARLRWAIGASLSAAITMAASPLAVAADATWTGNASGDFLNAANWSTNAVPGGGDNALFLSPTVTSLINFAGSRELGSFHLGQTGATGGNVDFSGGELVVHATFDRSHIGDRGSLDSKFVMRGNAVMLFDEPLNGGGAGLGSPGGNQDLEIGAQTGATGNLGLLELHDNAILRISDDLKIGAETNGNGEVRIDGNARITVGSGISISESNPSKGKMTIGGSSLVVSGNSAGAGNAAQGVTDEGYFTLSTNADATADVLIKDSGKVYTRTLQHRGGVSNLTIQDNGELHVFDTFNYAAPQLGVATVVGSPFGPQRASQLGENAGSEFNLLITGNGKMSVDSATMDPATGTTLQGLALSGANNRGAVQNYGGASNLELRDHASFVIQQNLYMTVSTGGGGASSELRIVGPNVDAEVKGDLLMSFNPVTATPNADPSTLAAVITGNTHSTLQVGGAANIGNGTLAVELSGYSPIGGETYTLLTANSISGSNFANFNLAPLASGLTWDVSVAANSVVLKVLGSTGLPGDFNSDLKVDGADFLLWQRGGSPSPLSAADLATWKANFGAPAVAAVGAVPEPGSVALLAMAVAGGIAVRRRR